MKLFIVVRWGNDDSPDKANGEDTQFLVRADDWQSAVSLVEPFLQSMPHTVVRALANVVFEVGEDSGTEQEAQVLLGPVLEYLKSAKGYQQSWRRDGVTDFQWKHEEEIDWD